MPITFAKTEAGWVVDGQAKRLAQRFGLSQIDDAALLSIASAGYTVGSATLISELQALAPGEIVVFRDGFEDPWRHRYYVYSPRPLDDFTSRDDLLDVTRRVFEKMIAGLDDRTVMVPLSAGYDSRLVVSALAELGYRNVRCFSYGPPGNHEAAGGKQIAERLGYPWTFIPHRPAQQRSYFKSTECREFEDFADTLQAIPFQQDYHAVASLKQRGYAPEDAVFVNGQAGDYTSGNHIPESLFEPSDETSHDFRWRRLLDAATAKHFDLWSSLKTPENMAVVEDLLRTDLEEMDLKLDDPANDFALFEASELRNRQSKYVIAGQRTYEWLGFEWRLPLGDRDYLDYWAAAPLAHKINQRLYRDNLVAANWGGVWGEGFWPKLKVVPSWMRPLRFAAKAAHAPLGRDRWHKFERQYIAWRTDLVCNYAIAPYETVARDRRGHRNAISWHAARYLERKGYAIAGTTVERMA